MSEATSRASAPDASRLEPLESRGPKPITYWAIIGAAFVLLNVWIFGHWFTSGDLYPTPTGPDVVPLKTKIAAIVFQAGSVCLAVAAVVVVVRQCRRERRVTFDGALMIAWVLASWQDPLINYVRPQFLFNAYFINFGGWAPYIPGWSSPLGGNLPEDVIGTAGAGYLWFVFVAMLACTGLRAVKRRWPGINQLGLFFVAFAIVSMVDLIVEYVCVRFLELWAYPGAVHALSIHGGSTSQFPVYETLFWGGVWAAVTMLRYNLDDHGFSAVERGATEIRGRRSRVTVLRVLAITGFLNVVYLTYSIIIVVFNLLPGTDTPPGLPSYLRDHICGDGTPYDCPAVDVPIYLNGLPR